MLTRKYPNSHCNAPQPGHLGLWLFPRRPRKRQVPGARLSVLGSTVPVAAPRAAWTHREVHPVEGGSEAQGRAGCGRAEHAGNQP